MPIYRLASDAIETLTDTSFAERGVKERADLQRLLKANVAVVARDVLVISEEFGEWENSKRRIDLLGIDKDANLVVIELKRDDDGGHMELQAIRYAGMVSSMKFARAIDVYQGLLDKTGPGQDARTKLLEFLEWDEPHEDEFGQDVRIILVAADFSKELTTAVLWLNERDLDIRCVRLKPYKMENETIIDAQQIIPLPELEEYIERVREKEIERREAARERVPFNGEYYVNFGQDDHRDWEDARRFEFVSAGQGPKYRDAMQRLEPGNRIWVNVPGIGYVGAGVVENAAVRVTEFTVENGLGDPTPLLQLDIACKNMDKNADDEAFCEYLVRVRWIKTIPLSDAVREPGMFGNQNCVAAPRDSRWPFTIKLLKERFGVKN